MFSQRPLSFLTLLLLLAACTVAVEPSAGTIAVERPTATSTTTITPASLPATSTSVPSPTPGATAELTIHPPLPVTPTPYLTATPVPPTATPQSVYADIWVGGFLMSHTELQVGNSAIPHLIHEGMFIPLQTADPETAAHLNSLPTRDVLVMAEGDFYYNGPEDYWLLVKTVELVNLPYSAETPLDATYSHTDPDFTFDYPAGWFVVPVENETEAVLRLHNVPPIVQEQHLWVGREFFDPTQFDFTLSLKEVTSVEVYVNERTAHSPCIEDVTTLAINGRSVTRITEVCYGTTVEYIFSLNEQIFSVTSWAQRATFIERVLATLR